MTADRRLHGAQFTYTACRRSSPFSDVPGWKVVETRPDLAAADRTAAAALMDRAASGVGDYAVPSASLPHQWAELPSALRLVRVDRERVALQHLAPAGFDFSHRTNVFVHGLLMELDLVAETPGLRPADLWGSQHWLRPVGAEVVEVAELVADDWWRESGGRLEPPPPDDLAAALVAFEAACSTDRRGEPPLLVVVSPDPGVPPAWLSFLQHLLAPTAAWSAPFGTWESDPRLCRSRQLRWTGLRADAADLLRDVPREDVVVLVDSKAAAGSGSAPEWLQDQPPPTPGPWAELAQLVHLFGLQDDVREQVDRLGAAVSRSSDAEPLWALGAATLLLPAEVLESWDDVAPLAAQVTAGRWPAAVRLPPPLQTALTEGMERWLQPPRAMFETVARRLDRREADAPGGEPRDAGPSADVFVAGYLRSLLGDPASFPGAVWLPRTLRMSRPASDALTRHLVGPEGVLGWTDEAGGRRPDPPDPAAEPSSAGVPATPDQAVAALLTGAAALELLDLEEELRARVTQQLGVRAADLVHAGLAAGADPIGCGWPVPTRAVWEGELAEVFERVLLDAAREGRGGLPGRAASWVAQAAGLLGPDLPPLHELGVVAWWCLHEVGGPTAADDADGDLTRRAAAVLWALVAAPEPPATAYRRAVATFLPGQGLTPELLGDMLELLETHAPDPRPWGEVGAAWLSDRAPSARSRALAEAVAARDAASGALPAVQLHLRLSAPGATGVLRPAPHEVDEVLLWLDWLGQLAQGALAQAGYAHVLQHLVLLNALWLRDQAASARSRVVGWRCAHHPYHHDELVAVWPEVVDRLQYLTPEAALDVGAHLALRTTWATAGAPEDPLAVLLAEDVGGPRGYEAVRVLLDRAGRNARQRALEEVRSLAFEALQYDPSLRTDAGEAHQVDGWVSEVRAALGAGAGRVSHGVEAVLGFRRRRRGEED